MEQNNQRPKVDVMKMIGDLVEGAEVIGPGSAPNRVKVRLNDSAAMAQTGGRFNPTPGDPRSSKEVELDTTKMFTDLGMDPAQVDFQIGSKSMPLNDSPMGFMERLKYEQARTPPNKAKFLANQYGAENVHFDSDAQRFRVKKDNAWYDADATGLEGFLSSEGDVATGAAVGGAVGSMLFPGVGSVAGALMGAGVGAIIARATSMNIAKQMGLRTLNDAEDVKGELQREFLLGLGGEAGALAVRGGVAGMKALNKSIQKVASTAELPAKQREVAKAMTDATGLDYKDSWNWLQNYEVIEPLQKEVIEWEMRGAQGVNPVRRQMADDVQSAVETAKETMYNDYDKAVKTLAPQLKEVNVDIAPVVQGMLKQYQDLGLIDENLQWITAREAELRKVVDPSSVRRLKQTYDIVNNAAKAAHERTLKKGYEAVNGIRLPFSEVQTLIRNTDEILEAAGQYKMSGPAAITTPAKAEIVGLRRALNKQAGQALTEADKTGKLAEGYANMNAKYSRRREWLDDMAYSTRDEKIDGTVQRLLGDDDRMRENFISMLTDSGLNAEKFVGGLMNKRTAINTVTKFNNETTGRGWIKAGWRRMAGAPERNAPLTAKAFNQLRQTAIRNEFLRTLPKSQMAEMLKNPVLLRQVIQTTNQAIETEGMVEETLINEALNRTDPNGGR